MITELVKHEVHTSDFKKENFFGVKDISILFEILRSKLYTMPLRTCLQEIISNALDANIENNRQDQPIEITCPDMDNMNISIRDYGIGIDPERITDVFLNYGSSTKNQSNAEHGGFGIGAKSPFAYTETFSIKTATTDGWVREYIAYIDETRIGKLVQINQKLHDGITGTTIIIPCKTVGDIVEVKQHIESICKYFDVPPLVNGKEVLKTERKYEYLGIDMSDIGVSLVEGGSTITILVGQIPYILQSARIEESRKRLVFRGVKSFNMLLKFKIGEIALSASREQIELSPKNYAAIGRKIQKAKVRIRQHLLKIFESMQTYEEKFYSYFGPYRFICDAIEYLPTFNGIQPVKQVSFSLCSAKYYYSVCSAKYYYADGRKPIASEARQLPLFQSQEGLTPSVFLYYIRGELLGINNRINRFMEMNKCNVFVLAFCDKESVDAAYTQHRENKEDIRSYIPVIPLHTIQPKPSEKLQSNSKPEITIQVYSTEVIHPRYNKKPLSEVHEMSKTRTVYYFEQKFGSWFYKGEKLKIFYLDETVRDMDIDMKNKIVICGNRTEIERYTKAYGPVENFMSAVIFPLIETIYHVQMARDIVSRNTSMSTYRRCIRIVDMIPDDHKMKGLIGNLSKSLYLDKVEERPSSINSIIGLYRRNTSILSKKMKKTILRLMRGIKTLEKNSAVWEFIYLCVNTFEGSAADQAYDILFPYMQKNNLC
jgi:anti-sigma regulatory factor (Ser/Thr protein kinase)